MKFVDYGEDIKNEERTHYLYIKDVNDSEAALLNHLGFEPLDSNDGRVVNDSDLETWVKYKTHRELEWNPDKEESVCPNCGEGWHSMTARFCWNCGEPILGDAFLD